jgi:hypothetical protein
MGFNAMLLGRCRAARSMTYDVGTEKDFRLRLNVYRF